MALERPSLIATPDIRWLLIGDPLTPYKAVVDGETWTIRINDFPAEHLYTLLVNGRETENFDDWPASWVRLKNIRWSSIDPVTLAEFVNSLRALEADSPEKQERMEQLARSFAMGVYQAAEKKAAQAIEEALGRRQ